MAIAILREFEATDDPGTPNYDAVTERIGIDDDPPAGLIAHTAGFDDSGVFRIFDVWESQADADRFASDRLMPAMKEVFGDEMESATAPTREATYELHHVVRGR